MSDTHKNLVAALRGRPSRKIANNTRLFRYDDGAVALTLHKTNILTARPDGSVVVNSGGWRTPTTKDRLNEYLADGLHIYQAGGIWYWSKRKPEGQTLPEAPAPVVFADGDVIGPRGAIRSAAEPGAEKAARELAKRVNTYAKLCAASVPMAPPSGGDCWHCALVVVPDGKAEPVQSRMHCAKGEAPRVLQKTLGDASNNKEHILSHIAESYVVPSLVMHALKEAGCGDEVIAGAFGKAPGFYEGIARDRVTRAVRRYIKRRLALAGN